jgi:hypothetical protein
MVNLTLPHALRSYRPGAAIQLAFGLGIILSVAVVAVGPSRLLAQIEGDRGIAPVASTGDIEVNGIQVNTTGKNAQEARVAGWKQAQRMAWDQLKGPAMSDGQIESMVSAVIVENEQLGPHRYIARLGVIFDRARAGQFVGSGSGAIGQRSAPLLTVPVLYSGGVAQIYEVRGPWQAAWAQFRAGASAIDYVRPSGGGGDSLLITSGQLTRRSRTWWRTLLDQFGAADVIMPEARIERQWPGGPIHGTFTARYGPDNRLLSSFNLEAKDEGGLPTMLAQAVQRMDRIYSDALAAGVLQPDQTLNAERPVLNPEVAALIAAADSREAASTSESVDVNVSAPTAAPAVVASTITIQFASPDVKAVDAALASVRTVPGVQSAATSSLAMGGTSVLRVSYAGTLEELGAALQARGWTVVAGNNALSIKR